MLKKIFDTIKKHPVIIFPIIAAICFYLDILHIHNFVLSLLSIISISISIILIAVWLKNLPWLCLSYIILLTYINHMTYEPMNSAYIVALAFIIFPIVNWKAYKNNTPLTNLFKTALKHQPTSADKYKMYRTLVLYYTSLVITSFPAAVASSYILLKTMRISNIFIHPINIIIITYVPIYIILCLVTLYAIISLFRIKKTNKQMKTDKTSAQIPETTDATKGRHQWLWMIFYILMMIILMPIGFFIFAYSWYYP